MPTRRQVLAAALAPAAGSLGAVRTRPRACPPSVPGQVRLGFVGDAMLGRSVNDRWVDAGDPGGVWDGLRGRLRGLDGLVANLECCLSDRGERRPGKVYYFRADPDWALPALRAAGVSAVSLANNHAMDFGPTALADTVAGLSSAGIANAGAGEDRAAALEPATVDVGEASVAVVALDGRSPGTAAGRDSPGTAYARPDPGEPGTRRAVGAALGRARDADPDLVVASLHWGPNWAIRPGRRQRSFARWLINAGVDVVHGHSAHVIQGVEVYRGRPILYDCGDIVDDYVIKEDLHNDRSFLFELVIEGGTLDRLRLRPVEIVDEQVRPAGATPARWLRERMRTLSAPFGTAIDRAGEGLVIPLACEDEGVTPRRDSR